MEGKVKGRIRMNPEFKATTHIGPMGIEGTGRAGFEGHMDVGTIGFETEQIPITMVIPFCRSRKQKLVAAIGGFKGRINPFCLSVKKASLEISGAVRTDRVEADVHGEVLCDSRVSAWGKVFGKIAARPSVEFNLDTGDEDECCDDDSDE